MLRSRLPIVAALAVTTALGACGIAGVDKRFADAPAQHPRWAGRTAAVFAGTAPRAVLLTGLGLQISLDTVLSIPYAIDRVVPILAGGK